MAHRDYDKHATLNSCTAAIQRMFQEPLAMGEPIYISDIQRKLSDLKSVIDVKKVRVQFARGGQYSDSWLDVNEAKSPDGRYIKIPQNCSAELKYPDNDVKGTVA